MFVLLLFFCSVLQIVQTSCPSGFTLERDGECRGYYTTMTLSWDQAWNTAIMKCKEIQSLPIIIHSAEQHTYWYNKWGGKGNEVLIGLMCNSITQRWVWADGSAVDYIPPGGTSKDIHAACSMGCSWNLYKTNSWSLTCSTKTWVTDIYCVKELKPPAPSEDGCDSFEDDKDDGVCYQIGTTAENWQEAQIICRSFGGNLASIHNQQENSFIRRLAVSKGAMNGLYLGATISGKGNTFGWIDGTEWDYANFYQGFPLAGAGDCLAMDTQNTDGLWMNLNCATDLAVACVRQQTATDTTPTCEPGPWKEGQIIYSPGFPMDASLPCEYFFNVEMGKNVRLEVLFLEANSCCDRLIVEDNFLGGKTIATLTGEIKDKIITTSSSNAMKVTWQPNGGVNVRGVMFTFRGV